MRRVWLSSGVQCLFVLFFVFITVPLAVWKQESAVELLKTVTFSYRAHNLLCALYIFWSYLKPILASTWYSFYFVKKTIRHATYLIRQSLVTIVHFPVKSKSTSLCCEPEIDLEAFYLCCFFFCFSFHCVSSSSWTNQKTLYKSTRPASTSWRGLWGNLTAKWPRERNASLQLLLLEGLRSGNQ